MNIRDERRIVSKYDSQLKYWRNLYYCSDGNRIARLKANEVIIDTSNKIVYSGPEA